MDDTWCGMAWQNVHSNEEGMEVLASIPNLDKRIKNFLASLEEDPCTNPHNAEVIARIEAQGRSAEGFRGCIVLSNSRSMCPACRLRLYFFHTVFNGGAYDPSLDEVVE